MTAAGRGRGGTFQSTATAAISHFNKNANVSLAQSEATKRCCQPSDPLTPTPLPQFSTLPQLQLGDCPKSASFSRAISHIKRWVETFRFFV